MPPDSDQTLSPDDSDLAEAMQRRGAGPITAVRVAHVVAKEEADDVAHSPYEQRGRRELYARAAELGIRGRSRMNRDQLIRALRDHNGDS